MDKLPIDAEGPEQTEDSRDVYQFYVEWVKRLLAEGRHPETGAVVAPAELDDLRREWTEMLRQYESDFKDYYEATVGPFKRKRVIRG